MHEKIIEILQHLSARLDGEEACETLEGAAAWLKSRGYTTAEISTALDLFCKKIQPAQRATTPAGGRTIPACRVMSAYEKEVFTPESFGYLLQFYQLGLVSIHELEHIIERAFMFGGRTVGKPELADIAASVILGEEPRRSRLMPCTNPDRIIH